MVGKHILEELYIKQNKTKKEVAEELNLPINDVVKALKKLKITKFEIKTEEDIRNEILLYNPEAILLSYTKASIPCHIRCSCGTEFDRLIFIIRKYKTCLCYACSGWKGASNGFKPHEVKAYIEKQGCQLVSEYVDVKKKMELICYCGKPFKQDFEIFRKGNHHGCTDCYYKKNQEEQRYKKEEIHKIISDSGCKWVSGE